MGRPSIYTPEIHKAIVAAIRAGAYDWVAAEANGIARTTFRDWIKRGERNGEEPFLSFSLDIRSARSQARLSAEIEVRKDQPFNWLRYGPGRERADEPGWTESKEVKHTGSVEILASEEWTLISVAIERALDPFPDARLAVTEALKALPGAALDEPRHEP